MRRYSSIVIIFIGLFVAMACDESSIPPDPAAAGNEYFPVGSDRFFIYDVEEVNYLLGGDIASTTYQLKEEWQFSFISDNDSVYVIYQYTRPSDMDVWQPASTLQVRKSDFNIALTEGNTPYVKLAFPVAEGKKWDGNALNQFEEDIYELDSIGAAYQGAMQFDNTLTVVQSNIEDFIVEYDRRYEIYALGVGLVLKEGIVLQFCTDENCLGQQEVVTGREYKQDLIAYGSL